MSDSIIFSNSLSGDLGSYEVRGDQRPREFVQGIERGLAVIRAFSAEHPTLSIAQVAERTGFTRAVARRYLLTFKTLGYIAHENGRFRLTPRLLDIGRTYLSTLNFSNVVQPHMINVTDTLQETCSVAVLDRDEIVFVARRPVKKGLNSYLAAGSRLPAHATSSGKVLLAHLPRHRLQQYLADFSMDLLTDNTIVERHEFTKALAEVRARGWAVCDEELALGVRAISVPIADQAGSVKAALSVAAHTSRVTVDQLNSHFLPVLVQAARGISQVLGDAATFVSQDAH